MYEQQAECVSVYNSYIGVSNHPFTKGEQWLSLTTLLMCEKKSKVKSQKVKSEAHMPQTLSGLSQCLLPEPAPPKSRRRRDEGGLIPGKKVFAVRVDRKTCRSFNTLGCTNKHLHFRYQNIKGQKINRLYCRFLFSGGPADPLRLRFRVSAFF